MRYRFGDHELDTDAFELRARGEVVVVEPQVFDVLAHLVAHRDRVVPKEELLDEIWGDRFVSESALSSRIMSARKAVGDDGRRQGVIKTLHGRGFRFVAPVEELSDEPSTGPATSAANRSHPRRAAPRTRYADSAHGSIAYQVVGDGPTDLLFVPGFVSNVELQWEFPPMASFFDRLASFARLITFDKRGTGVSERLPAGATLSLEERMDDVRAVMDAAGSERATLMGISEGGPMSVLFAATHPERVERLVLVNTFGGSFIEGVSWTVDMIEQWWGTGAVYRFLAPSWDHPDDARFLARYERNSGSPATAAATVAMNADIDVRPLLPAIATPTLVLHRRDDQVVPLARGQEIAEGIPNARLVVLDGSDHLAFADAEPILTETESFVTDATSAPSSERRLVTLLVVTAADGALPDGLVPDHLRGALVTEVRHGAGTEVDVDGPVALAATFEGPARAIRTARGIVASAIAAGVPVRCGVHTGEVGDRGGRLAGINVTVACQVALAAAAAEVWVTGTVRDLVAGSELAFDARGTHHLGDLTEPRPLYAVR